MNRHWKCGKVFMSCSTILGAKPTVLCDLNAQGLSILLVEQLAAHALVILHRAYVVARGQIEIEGPSHAVAASPTVMEALFGKKRSSVRH